MHILLLLKMVIILINYNIKDGKIDGISENLK